MTKIGILPDIARQKSAIPIPISKVGIHQVPVMRKWQSHQVMTRQSAFIDLPKERGIHMSRLVKVLLRHEDEVIHPDSTLLRDLLATHEYSSMAYWICKWDSIKTMPPNVRLPLQHKLEGTYDLAVPAEQWFYTVIVPYSTLCPCSQELCAGQQNCYPHMQRGYVKVTAQCAIDDWHNWCNRLIDAIISALPALPRDVMSRAEELEWCRSIQGAFVEDVTRRVANVVGKFSDHYVVIATHEETIHPFDVVAIVRSGDLL